MDHVVPSLEKWTPTCCVCTLDGALATNGKPVPDPRYAFASFPYLYKIQLAGTVARAEPDSADPCREFLAVFLPQLKEYQIDPTQSDRSESEEERNP